MSTRAADHGDVGPSDPSGQPGTLPQQRCNDTDLVASLWRAEQTGESISPEPILPATAENGYRLQWRGADFRSDAGVSPVGFKIGLLTPSAPSTLSAQRGYGLLYGPAVGSSPAQVRLAMRSAVTIEAELAVRIGAEIAPEKLTGARLVAAIDEMMAAIEVVWSRWDGRPPGLPAWLADNASAGYAVLGPPINARRELLADVGASITVDGAAAASGRSPIAPASLDWLASMLSMQGRTIQRGTVILTGAAAVVTGVKPGTVNRVEIEGIGEAVVSLQ